MFDFHGVATMSVRMMVGLAMFTVACELASLNAAILLDTLQANVSIATDFGRPVSLHVQQTALMQWMRIAAWALGVMPAIAWVVILFDVVAMKFSTGVYR
jgi:hypothetical protein